MRHSHHCCGARHRSIFIKLMVVIIITGILVNALVGLAIILFGEKLGFPSGLQSGFFLSLFFLVSLGFIIAHLVIRRLLKPVRWLAMGVSQLQEGNLEFQIPVRGRDEFSGFTEAFNKMVKRIKEMIEARDRLLLDVSHELRSPLTRIKVALELLPESAERDKISADLAEMETMITEILESERLKNGHGKLTTTDVDLVEVLSKLAAEYQNVTPGVVIKEQPERAHLRLDVDRIKILFKNIIDNAVKYSFPESKPIEITIAHTKNNTTVSVKDDGGGIPQEDLPYIFEPFYRVDRSRAKEKEGYGLGLSLCKKIMEAHGGTIEIVNNRPRGTTVEMVFKN